MKNPLLELDSSLGEVELSALVIVSPLELELAVVLVELFVAPVVDAMVLDSSPLAPASPFGTSGPHPSANHHAIDTRQRIFAESSIVRAAL
jgi:hypothetical protein